MAAGPTLFLIALRLDRRKPVTYESALKKDANIISLAAGVIAVIYPNAQNSSCADHLSPARRSPSSYIEAYLTLLHRNSDLTNMAFINALFEKASW